MQCEMMVLVVFGPGSPLSRPASCYQYLSLLSCLGSSKVRNRLSVATAEMFSIPLTMLKSCEICTQIRRYYCFVLFVTLGLCIGPAGGRSNR